VSAAERPLIALVAAHVLVGLALAAGGRGLGRRGFGVAAAVPAVGFLWTALQTSDVFAGRVPEEQISWVPRLGLSLDLRLDGFSLLFVLIVTGIGTLVLLYAGRYFSPDRAELERLAGLLLVFTGAMLGIVTSANLLVLFVAWEVTSITSYLLIGWNDEDPKARASALQALLTTEAGGVRTLGGEVLM